MKDDKLKTVTSKEENYNTINFDPGVIEKSKINTSDEPTWLLNARCKRMLSEDSASEKQFIVSVRYPAISTLWRSFTQQATVGGLYNWVDPLNNYPIYFKLVYLSTESKPTDRMYWMFWNVLSQHSLKKRRSWNVFL